MSTTMPSADSKVAESGTVVDYGGIPHVAVLVGDAQEAQQYYTHVLGMSPDVEGSECLAKDDVPGACVRVGAQTIYLLELPNPDPLDVDPSYSMSAPPKGYVANGRPVHQPTTPGTDKPPRGRDISLPVPCATAPSPWQASHSAGF